MTGRPKPRRWTRVVAIAAVVAIYTVYRGLRVGAGRDVFERGLPVEPFRHALTVIKVEHALWLDIEQGVQEIFLPYGWFIRVANAYYAFSHQVMTLGLVIVVLLKAPWRDATRWVGALLLQLPIALVFFRFYPLMPPRLLDSGPPWGGRILQIHREIRPTGIVDTLVTHEGPWTPAPVSVSGFVNQYAAMPSLHCAFAMWVAIVWWQFFRGKPWRIVGPLHVCFVFLCTLVTGNHFVVDAVVGWAIAIGALAFTSLLARRQQGSSSRMSSITATSQKPSSTYSAMGLPSNG